MSLLPLWEICFWLCICGWRCENIQGESTCVYDSPRQPPSPEWPDSDDEGLIALLECPWH